MFLPRKIVTVSVRKTLQALPAVASGCIINMLK